MTDPELFVAENLQAEEAINAGDYPRAARILVPIVEKDPQNWRAYNNMGIISWMQKAWDDSYTMFERAVSLKPDYADAIVNLFDACLKLRRITQATPLFQKAFAASPQSEEIRVIYEGIRDQGEDIYTCERALKIGVHNPRIEEANKLVEDGKYFEAMEKYLAVNDTEGANADAFCGLGVVSYYQQRYDDAFSLFFESIKLNPLKTDTFLNFLDAAKACGKTVLAKQVFQVYLKEIPSLTAVEADFGAA